MKRPFLFLLPMFVWLSVGYAAVHVTVSLWSASVIQSIWPETIMFSPEQPEQILITQDGEVLLSKYSFPGGWTYHNFDGTPVPNALGIHQSLVLASPLSESDSGEPSGWNQRINSYHDFQKPATSWYLIAPPSRSNTAYFVGYDNLSRKLMGYIGVNGFSTEVPTIEQSFLITPMSDSAFRGSVAASQSRFNWWAAAWEPIATELEAQYIPKSNTVPDAIWIRSKEGTIYEIRLGARTVRTLLQDRTDLRMIEQMTYLRDDKSYLQLLTRTDAGIVIIDPESKQLETIPLDRDPAMTTDSFYQLKNGRRIVVLDSNRWQSSSSRSSKQTEQSILWLDSNGNIEKKVDRTAPVHSAGPTLVQEIGMSLAFPAPLLSIGALAVMPIFRVEFGKTSMSYFESLIELFLMIKVWLAISILTGIATGWACWRREREVFKSSTWFWPIVVGLCGWFGWMGYICLKPLPARMSNREWLPAQPEPAEKLGSEIFA